MNEKGLHDSHKVHGVTQILKFKKFKFKLNNKQKELEAKMLESSNPMT